MTEVANKAKTKHHAAEANVTETRKSILPARYGRSTKCGKSTGDGGRRIPEDLLCARITA